MLKQFYIKLQALTISKTRLILIVSIPIQVILFRLITKHSDLIEKIYSQFLYKGIVYILRFILGWIPLPVSQVVLYLLLITPLVWVILLIIRVKRHKIKLGKTLWNTFTFLLAAGSVTYFLFMILWGLNYHRKPIAEQMNLNPNDIKVEELQQICNRLIILTNQSRKQLTSDELHPVTLKCSKKEMIEKALQGYANLSDTFPSLSYKQLSVKKVYLPKLMSTFGISGIYIPFTGEAVVNMDPPSFNNPVTICHEMAHQLGYAPEDEANYIAFLVCRANHDPAFQYSGYFMAMRYAMNTLAGMKPEAFKELRSKLSKGVLADINANRTYWNSFYNPVIVFSNWFYDLFLKANGQTHGIRSYSLMVKLMVAENRKHPL